MKKGREEKYKILSNLQKKRTKGIPYTQMMDLQALCVK